MKIAIAGQIAEVERELAMRRNVYPRAVAKGNMRESEAQLCLARMEAVLATLRFCQQHERDIRVFIRNRDELAKLLPAIPVAHP